MVIVVALLLMATGVKAHDPINGKVIAVIDGNTLEVAAKDQVHKILLAEIDCPELGQQYGDAARELLEKLVLEKEVTITIKGKDRLGNQVGVVMVKGKKDPRVDLLQHGLAWTAEKNPNAELESLKIAAKEKSKGLWRQEDPVPPWTYRRQQTMQQPKSS
jgi:endonuclease YncB( thermonuclease family)